MSIRRVQRCACQREALHLFNSVLYVIGISTLYRYRMAANMSNQLPLAIELGWLARAHS